MCGCLLVVGCCFCGVLFILFLFCLFNVCFVCVLLFFVFRGGGGFNVCLLLLFFRVFLWVFCFYGFFVGILLLLLNIPLYAHDSERHDRTQDGHGLHVEDELTQEPAERPREREERRTLKNNMDALTHSAGWL